MYIWYFYSGTCRYWEKPYYCRNEYDCFQIELAKNYGVAEWREDLRQVMMKAGLENKPTVFLFSDTQVSNTKMYKTGKEKIFLWSLNLESSLNNLNRVVPKIT